MISSIDGDTNCHWISVYLLYVPGLLSLKAVPLITSVGQEDEMI